jgi:dinuclear metal center YbgI/SA1388 family protein
MSVTCKDIIDILESIAPSYLAQDWDNVGLQIGDAGSKVSKIMVCLDLSSGIVDEAVSQNIDMIITHHPLIFKPLKKITTEDSISRIISKLIKNDINLYCAHTNLDISTGGTSDYIAKLLQLRRVKPLSYTYNEKYYKLVVFVPKHSVEDVRDAISMAGAGHIGNYSHCTFQTEGIGTFKPLEGANPYIGTIDSLEKVDEVRLESIVSGIKLNKVIDAMLEAHPYEEVAHDIIPLANKANRLGFGRIGYLDSPISLIGLAETLKLKLKTNTLKIVGDMDKEIEKIAICTGSGADFIKDAYKNRCDCYITGDIKYHEAQYAAELGLPVIDAGHYETENIICIPLKNRLKEEFEKKNYAVEVINSNIDINPFKFI